MIPVIRRHPTIFGMTVFTKCSTRGEVAKTHGTSGLVCFSIFSLSVWKQTPLNEGVNKWLIILELVSIQWYRFSELVWSLSPCSGVNLPICSNMTHILFHYCKLPADRYKPNCPPEGWDQQLWDRQFKAQRELNELKRWYLIQCRIKTVFTGFLWFWWGGEVVSNVNFYPVLAILD